MRLPSLREVLKRGLTCLELVGLAGVVFGFVAEYAYSRLMATGGPREAARLIAGNMRLSDALRVLRTGLDRDTIARVLNWGALNWGLLGALLVANVAARGWWLRGGVWRRVALWVPLGALGWLPAVCSLPFMLTLVDVLSGSGAIEGEVVSEGHLVTGGVGMIVIATVGRALLSWREQKAV
jgi:hypothetical protein